MCTWEQKRDHLYKGIGHTKLKMCHNLPSRNLPSPSRNVFWVQEAAAIVKGIVETLINVV